MNQPIIVSIGRRADMEHNIIFLRTMDRHVGPPINVAYTRSRVRQVNGNSADNDVWQFRVYNVILHRTL